MDEDVMNSLSKFRLVEKEDEGIVLDKMNVRKCKEECERSLLGNIWGIKFANFSGVNNTFNQLWCQTEDLKVVELGGNFYHFIFSNQEDKKLVMKKRLWFIDNQMPVIQHWQPDLRRGGESLRRPFCGIRLEVFPITGAHRK